MSSNMNLNCILVLDEDVKSSLQSSIYNLTIYGVTIINNIKEITKEMLESTNKVVFLGAINYNSLENLKFYKEVLELDYYFISDDELILDLVSDFCKCFYLNYVSIDSNLLYSVLMDDKVEQNKYRPIETKLTRKEELEKSLAVATNEDKIKCLKEMILYNDLLSSKLSSEKSLKNKIADLELDLINRITELDLVQSAYDDLLEKVLKQNSVLKDYEIYLTEDLYKSVSTAKYPNRPKILYFKEFQPLIHEYSFFKTLFDMFRVQAKKSCKVIRLHDSHDLVRIKTLENKYKLVNSKFLESDIINSDFILSYGNYSKLFDILLTNKGGLDILIILDCKSFDETVIEDSEMIYFNICRNPNVMSTLGLKPVNTINNNNKDSIMSWDTYAEFSSIKSPGDKFTFLASREVIKRIYSLYKGFS